MLILTRRVDESILIGENVTITIVEISSTRVRIGIDAPKEIKVHRAEIYQRIQPDQSHDSASSDQ